MAAPYPPQGHQQMYTERPYKVYGEQYVSGGPLPVGTVTASIPPLYEDGRPRVHTASGATKDLHEGDWVLSNRYTGAVIDVISDEEFTERFGGGAPLQGVPV
jgi:hypothetical protein